MKKFIKLIAVGLMTVLMAAMLLACAPSTLDKAKEKLEEKDYLVVKQEINDDDVVGAFVATRVLKGKYILAVLYENAGAAKDAVADWEDEIKDGDKGVYREGKWIIIATEDAYEDFMA